MSDAETRELLSWISERPRSYSETIEVWKTNCPRHSLSEDALGEGLVQIVRAGRKSGVALTQLGEDVLARTITVVGT
jgi:hypothetical protein